MSAVVNAIGQPIGNVYHDLSEAEIEAGLARSDVVDNRYWPGLIHRYWTNTSPGVTDMGPAIRISGLVASLESGTASRPTIYIPSGLYLINPVAGDDGYSNGLHIPRHTADNPVPEYGVRIVGDGSSTQLVCGDDDMVMFRISRSFCDVENLYIRGGGKTGVIGVGIVPADMTDDDTNFANQQYCIVRRLSFANLSDGVKMQPGPDVGASESGCFHNRVLDCWFNFCNRGVWFAPPATVGSDNRCTRSSVERCVILRGNTGVHIEKGTEIEILSPSMSLLDTTRDAFCPDGTGSPLTVPTAVRIDGANSWNNSVIGGYAEACDRGIEIAEEDAARMTNLMLFYHNSVPHVSESLCNRIQPGKWNVSRAVDANGTIPARLSFDNTDFVGFVADPDDDGSKTLAFETNGDESWRWRSTRANAHIGTSSNLIIRGEGVPEYADDAAAAAGGVNVGELYRTASAIKIRVA